MTRCFFHIGLPFIFLVSFSVYLVTLNPTFQPDDSAETVAACATLTPQHPSGYPLYTLLGSLASHLPLGSEPFRVNLLATFLGALGVVFTAIYLFRAMILFNPENGVGVAVLSAFGGSLILAFSKTYWLQSISAKGGIYILQSFIFLAAIYLIEKLDENPERNKAFCACPMLVWMLSLGSANGWEMLILFCAAGLVYFLFRGSVELKKMELNAKNIIGMIALSLIGFSVYLLLPLRPGLKNIMVWGDTQSLRGFLHFFSDYDVRREMGLKWIKNMVHFSINQRDWNEAWNQIFRQGQQFNQISDHLTSDVGLWTWIPLILGVLYFYRHRKYVFLFFGLTTVFFLIVANGFVFHLEDENLWCIDKFLIPVNIFQSIGAGAGIGFLILKATKFQKENFGQNTHGEIEKSPVGFLAVGMAIVLFFPVLSIFENLRSNDQSSQTWAYDYGADLMKSLKKDTIFFAEGDNATFSLLFFQGVLHQRMDVTLIPADYLWIPWGGKELEEKLPQSQESLPSYAASDLGTRVSDEMDTIIHQNSGKRPIQFSANLDLLDRCYFSHQPTVVQTGNLFSLLRPYGLSLDWGTALDQKGLDLLNQLKQNSPLEKKAAVQGPMAILSMCQAQAYFNASEYYGRIHLWEKADYFYPIALDQSANPKLLGRIWEGWADYLLSRGRKSEALEAYQKSIDSYPEPTNYAKLTRFYFNNGRYSEALNVALKSAEDFPDSTAARRDAVVCEAALKKTGK